MRLTRYPARSSFTFEIKRASRPKPDILNCQKTPLFAGPSLADQVFGKFSGPSNGPYLDGSPPPALGAGLGLLRVNSRENDTKTESTRHPSPRRILPDLLSAAREEERAREAQMLLNGRRLPQCPRTPARPKTAQPEAVQPEEPVRSRRLWNARAVESQGEAVPPRPEVAAFVATAAPDVDQAPVSAEPSGAGRGNAIGLLPRKVKRVGQPIPLRAGERWKRRLPPVCH